MSLLSERCSRIREQVGIEDLFEALNWDFPVRGRIRCLWPDHDDRSPAMQVYRETNSVYCFACGKGGDVVELLWKAGNPEGGEWTLDEALEWAEGTFGLERMTAASSLKQRLHRKLSATRRKPAESEPNSDLIGIVKEAFDRVEREPSTDLQLGADIKDYVWSQTEDPDVDLSTWVVWARRMVFGPYSWAINLKLPNPPPKVIDDSPQALVRARVWEHHRGLEYPNPWPWTMP